MRRTRKSIISGLVVAASAGVLVAVVTPAIPAFAAAGTQPPAWSTTLSMQAGAASTVAGNGTAGHADGTGAAAAFNQPTGMSIANGYGYVIDAGYVRKVTLATGVVSTVAGDGTAGCVDGATAGTSEAAYPYAGSVVNDGSYLYWAQSCSGNTKLRKMALSSGVISTTSILATAVTIGPGGVLFVGSGETVSRVDPASGAVTTVATLPSLSSGASGAVGALVEGLASDGTDLWATSYSSTSAGYSGYDTSVGAVQRITLSTGAVTAVYSARAPQPYLFGTLVSAGSLLYVVAQGNGVFQFNKSSGALVGIAGTPSAAGYADGASVNAWFNNLSGIDTDGTALWVTDTANNRVRKIAASAPLPVQQPAAWSKTLSMPVGAVSTLAGNGTAGHVDGPAGSAEFTNVMGMTLAGGFGYVGDNGYIRKVDLSTGATTTVAGSGPIASGSQYCTDSTVPSRVVLSAGSTWNDGSFLYWLDSCQWWTGPQLRRMSLTTYAVSTVPESIGMQGISVGPGGKLYGWQSNQFYRIDPVTGQSTSFAQLPQLVFTDASPAHSGTYPQSPVSMAFDGGTIWVSATASVYWWDQGPISVARSVLSKIDVASGAVTTVYQQNSDTTPYVAGKLVNAGSALYLAQSSQVSSVNKTTAALTVMAGSSTSGYSDGTGAAAAFSNINAIDTDGAYLLVADQSNNRIRKIGVGVLPMPVPPSVSGTGSGNTSVANPSCSCGDPVSTASGDFYESRTDLAIGGVGPGVAVSRGYNSNGASASGLFGYGWASNLSINLVKNASTGAVTFTDSDGSQATATLSGSTYAFPSWADSTLTATSSGWTMLQHRTKTMTFNSSGQLTAVTDLNGYSTTFAYTSGKVSSVTDTTGRAVAISYGSNGLISQIKAPDNSTTKYFYDTSGNLTSVQDPLNRTEQYGYATPSSHLLTTVTDPRGNVTQNWYDTSNRVYKQKDRAGLISQFAYTGDNYSTSGGTTTLTDPHGAVTTFQYLQGALQSKTDLAGTSRAATTSYTYDPATFSVTAVQDPLGRITQYVPDAAGNPTQVTDPAGNTTITTYNSLNEPLVVTGADGRKTTNTYDAAGNLQSSTADGTAATGSDESGCPTSGCTATTTYTYSPTQPGVVTQVTDLAGHKTGFTRDTYGNATQTMTYPSTTVTNTATASFDVLGRMVCAGSPVQYAKGVVCPAAGQPHVAGTNTTVYDADGEVTSSADAVGNTTPTAPVFDPDGNVTQSTDYAGRVSTATYDAANRVLTKTVGSGTSAALTTTYSYDIAAGTAPCTSGPTSTVYCASKTVGSQQTVDFFDGIGNVVQEIQPSAGKTVFTYDLANQPLTAVSPTGTTTYAYDVVGHIKTVTYSAPAAGYKVTPNVSYTYDTLGRRASMTDGTGTTTYTYDALGRTSATADGAGHHVGYGYDTGGENTALTYPSGQTVTKTFDGAGELSSTTDLHARVTSFAYDADGNTKTITSPNGTLVTESYNANDAPTTSYLTAGTTSLAMFAAASKDPTSLSKGEITSADVGGATASKYTPFTYDAQARLATTKSVSATYDAQGDPTTVVNVNTAGTTVTTAQTFTLGNSQVTSTTPSGGVATTFGYDTAGDRTAATTTGAGSFTYAYNQAGEMTAENTRDATGALTAIASYKYNGDGLRTSKNNFTTGALSITWSGSRMLADGQRSYIYGPTGQVLEQEDTSSTGNPIFLFANPLGTPLALTDLTGTATAGYAYNTSGTLIAKTGTGTTPIGFDGGYTDTETGLIYYQHRYYDPGTQQFTTVDPLVDTTDQPYSYAANDPANASDPTGLLCLIHNDQGGCWGGDAYDWTVTNLDPLYQPTMDVMSYFDDNPAPCTQKSGAQTVASAVGGAASVGGAKGGKEEGPVDENPGPTSGYKDSTDSSRGKSSIKNVNTGIPVNEFEANLTANGWSKTTYGDANVYTKDGAKYSVYYESSSTDGPTAAYTPRGANKPQLKLRLASPPVTAN